jgi:hypothetical protein
VVVALGANGFSGPTSAEKPLKERIDNPKHAASQDNKQPKQRLEAASGLVTSVTAVRAGMSYIHLSHGNSPYLKVNRCEEPSAA